MARPILYILCGLPFAGKTTIAQKLVQKFSMHHIEVDAIRRERGIGIEGQTISERAWERIFAESYCRLVAALRRGENVLYDATNYDKGVRDHLRELAYQQGAVTAVIYVATSADVANQRRQHNETIRQRRKVADEDFNEVVTGFEVPAEDENVLWYDPSTPIDEWIARTFR